MQMSTLEQKGKQLSYHCDDPFQMGLECMDEVAESKEPHSTLVMFYLLVQVFLGEDSKNVTAISAE